MKILKGYKTYIVAAVMVAVGAAETMGLIPYGTGQTFGLDGSGTLLIMNGLGFAGLRHGMNG